MNFRVNRTPLFLESLFPSIIWGGADRQNGAIYLTFDDGPDPLTTPLILDFLNANRIPAAFFFRGDRIEAHHDLMSQLDFRLHLIGYHGFTHRAWCFLSKNQREKEMNPFSHEESILTETYRNQNHPLLLRPPYGRFTLITLRQIKMLKGRLVLWRLVLNDWLSGKIEDQIADDFISQVCPGDIVVFHDGGKNGHLLQRVLEKSIPCLLQSGLHFGSLAELCGQ